jgi:hypothetical protein
MKKNIRNIGSAALLGLTLITAQALVAQDAVESTSATKTVTSAGTITEFSPDTIVIKS